MQATDLETLKPILIWLHEPGMGYDESEIDRVVAAAESWILRRALVRLPLGDLGRIVADLVKQHRLSSNNGLGERVEKFRSRQNAASTYWPGVAEIEKSLAAEAAYKRFKRGRLRMFLEAAEDHLRGYTGSRHDLTGSRVPRIGYPIEHLLPQKWESHWPVDDLAAEVERRDHVHRLGNLTLLTSALNASVSIGPWLGSKGKRAKLHDHDVFLTNRHIEDVSADGWDETLIDERSRILIHALLATWPVPEGHTGEVVDTGVQAAASVSLKQLVAAGLIAPGTVLRARPGVWGHHEAVVLDNGDLSLDGQVFNSPSAAGHHLQQGATNGWYFWILPDGRRLTDVRAAYRSTT